MCSCNIEPFRTLRKGTLDQTTGKYLKPENSSSRGKVTKAMKPQNEKGLYTTKPHCKNKAHYALNANNMERKGVP